MRYSATLTIAGALLVCSAAAAQMTDGSSAQQGAPTATAALSLSVDSMDIKVLRIVKDPSAEGAVRLITRVSNTADKDRRILFVGPQASLIDDLGNVLAAVDTVGIEHCSYQRKWYPELGWCAGQYKDIATKLTPGLAVTVAFIFQPSSPYAKDLADLSQSYSLRARVAHYSDDMTEPKSADIIINDVPLPK